MPSLVPGFEYDIFISYRHKDNKGDHWVTEFVAALKNELECTFKEEINVYFDENPHDGLLETHNVDKSLEGKLKCLILIPIISRTYCDARSFAWQQEFLPFIRLAKADEFGIDIKLTNGNVASRVLPVRIHDLDDDDKSLLENQLQGALRPVDFIYRTSGVNRPLRAMEENSAKNLNNTQYRDQINKVANAIKEIVSGMTSHEIPSKHARQHKPGTFTQSKKVPSKSVRITLWALLLTSLGLAGTFGYRALQEKNEVIAIRNGSIAIIPFENQTGRTDLTSIGQVASDFISTKLTQNQFWKVIPTQDVFRQTIYSGTNTNPEAEKKISSQINIDYLVLGHYNLIDDSILLVVSVNDVTENKVLYTTPVIKSAVTNPMKAISDAQQFVLGYLMFSKDEDEMTTRRPPTYDAYQEYLKGMEIWTKNNFGPGNIMEQTGSEIEKNFKNAIKLDADFLPPYFKLAEIFFIYRKFNLFDSVLDVLEGKQKLFAEGDELNFNMQKLISEKNWNGLEIFLLSKTESGSSEFRPYVLLAANALFKQNMPKKALRYVEKCDLTKFDFENKPSDQLLYAVKIQALIELRRFHEANKVTDNLGFKIKVADILPKRWLILYYLNKKDQADKEIGKYLLTAKPTDLIPNITTFRVALLQGDTVAMATTYRQFKKFISAWNDSILNSSFYKFHLAVMMFRSKDNIAEAETMLSQNMAVVPRPRRLHQLGILYAVTGRPEQAKEVVKDLLLHENPYDNGITRYYIAKIEAVLGHKEKSVEYLRQSIDKGMEFREELFEFDADLKNLFEYPPFIALVTPKE